MKRVDIFIYPQPGISQYGVLPHFSIKLHEAFQAIGIKSRLLDLTEPSYIYRLALDPPEYMISFNGTLPDKNGLYFCDKVGIPQICYLLDSPHKFMLMKPSPRLILTHVDRQSVPFFQGLGFENVHFMPHAIESTISHSDKHQKDFDVLMLASFIDYRLLRGLWVDKFGAAISTILNEAAEESLLNDRQAYYQIFREILERPENVSSKQSLTRLQWIELLDQVDLYMRGKERFELLNAIKDARVDVFGTGVKGWERYLDSRENIIFHDAVDFTRALEFMGRSKIVLNSSPLFRKGAHERVFAALACGSLPLTNENSYLCEEFAERESIAFFQYSRLDAVNDVVNEYLMNDALRETIITNGREIVLKRHTWKQRAEALSRMF